jgi:hypothetical protein
MGEVVQEVSRSVTDMTDRELAEETVLHLRNISQLVGGVIQQMQGNPMFQAMMGRSGR